MLQRTKVDSDSELIIISPNSNPTSHPPVTLSHSPFHNTLSHHYINTTPPPSHHLYRTTRTTSRKSSLTPLHTLSHHYINTTPPPLTTFIGLRGPPQERARSPRPAIPYRNKRAAVQFPTGRTGERIRHLRPRARPQGKSSKRIP